MRYEKLRKIKSGLNKIIWKVVFSKKFLKYGKNVNIYQPESLIGEEYIVLGDSVYIGYKSSIIVINNLENGVPLLTIGAGTKIRRFSHLVCANEISIGSNVLIADSVFITDNSHAYEKPDIPIIQQGLVNLGSVSIGDESWLGERVSVIGSSIGKHCIIGAGSVVTKNIPDYSVAVGVPAKIVKKYSQENGTWEQC